jgi:hypothetical protein
MTSCLQVEAGWMTDRKIEGKDTSQERRPSIGGNPLPFITCHFSSAVLQTVAKIVQHKDNAMYATEQQRGTGPEL